MSADSEFINVPFISTALKYPWYCFLVIVFMRYSITKSTSLLLLQKKLEHFSNHKQHFGVCSCENNLHSRNTWRVHKSLSDTDLFSQLLATSGQCFKLRISLSYFLKLLSYIKFPSCHHHHQGTISESSTWQIQPEVIKVAGESGNSL